MMNVRIALAATIAVATTLSLQPRAHAQDGGFGPPITGNPQSIYVANASVSWTAPTAPDPFIVSATPDSSDASWQSDGKGGYSLKIAVPSGQYKHIKNETIAASVKNNGLFDNVAQTTTSAVAEGNVTDLTNKYASSTITLLGSTQKGNTGSDGNGAQNLSYHDGHTYSWYTTKVIPAGQTVEFDGTCDLIANGQTSGADPAPPVGNPPPPIG